MLFVCAFLLINMMYPMTICTHAHTAWSHAEEDQEDAQLWEDNWDDDDVDEQFSLQLRQELEKHSKGIYLHTHVFVCVLLMFVCVRMQNCVLTVINVFLCVVIVLCVFQQPRSP